MSNALLSPRVRRVVFQLHLWVALILFLPLVPLGLTGSALVWPATLNRLANPPPQASAGAALPRPGPYLEAASAVLPEGARLQSVRWPARPGEPVTVSASAGRQGPGGGLVAWLDPASASVLKTGSSTSGLFRFAHDFHGQFMAGGAGRQLVGIAGVPLLFLSVTGLWLWWPRGAFAKGFRWRRTPSTMNNLHHLVGFWIALPLAILSLTGVLIAFPSLMGAGGPPRPAGEARPAAAAPRTGTPVLSADEAAARALSTERGARLVAVTLPGAGRGRPGPALPDQNAWRVELAARGGSHTVVVDDATGAVRAPSAPAAGGERRGSSAMGLVRGLHEGGAGGLVWEWIVFLAGLAPTLLAGTGVYLWAKGQLRKAALRRPEPQAAN